MVLHLCRYFNVLPFADFYVRNLQKQATRSTRTRLQAFSPVDPVCCAQPVGWPAASEQQTALMEVLDVRRWRSKSLQLLHFMSGRCETVFRVMSGGPHI